MTHVKKEEERQNQKKVKKKKTRRDHKTLKNLEKHRKKGKYLKE